MCWASLCGAISDMQLCACVCNLRAPLPSLPLSFICSSAITHYTHTGLNSSPFFGKLTSCSHCFTLFFPFPPKHSVFVLCLLSSSTHCLFHSFVFQLCISCFRYHSGYLSVIYFCLFYFNLLLVEHSLFASSHNSEAVPRIHSFIAPSGNKVPGYISCPS